MAESDRQRLLARAMELPQAHESDFFGRKPPADADPAYLKTIADTSLRTKLVEARVAEGLQSPKGPQKIASIVRIYPDFNAPGRAARSAPSQATRNGPAKKRTIVAPPRRARAPIEEMERLTARIRQVEAQLSRELAARLDERIDELKRELARAAGDELETAYHALGEALKQRRVVATQALHEAFRQVEADGEFPPRAFIGLLEP
jgi:hypothetical protein